MALTAAAVEGYLASRVEDLASSCGGAGSCACSLLALVMASGSREVAAPLGSTAVSRLFQRATPQDN
jgi:hypothetical protein